VVRAHRDKIDRVAQALLKHKTLSADQVRTVMFPEFVKVVA
jgi:ATP-dependent Zn protease